MFKNFSISVFILLSVFTYGQKSTLLQNINFRAQELKHSLNKSEDSLILQSDKTIYSVEIFNQDFEKTVEVRGNETKISLNGTPLGRLVVSAQLSDKRILMTLLRHEILEENSEKKQQIKPRLKAVNLLLHKIPYNTNKEADRIVSILNKQKCFDIILKAKIKKPEPQIASIEQDETIDTIENNTSTTTEARNKPTSSRPRTSFADMLNWKSKKRTKNQKFYWVAEEINSGNSSHKTMKLVRQDIALNMISKNKIESKTSFGKLNRLTVWEVYNTKMFMQKQVKNPDYINSSSSDFFNVIPYYITANNLLAVN